MDFLSELSLSTLPLHLLNFFVELQIRRKEEFSQNYWRSEFGDAHYAEFMLLSNVALG